MNDGEGKRNNINNDNPVAGTGGKPAPVPEQGAGKMKIRRLGITRVVLAILTPIWHFSSIDIAILGSSLLLAAAPGS